MNKSISHQSLRTNLEIALCTVVGVTSGSLVTSCILAGESLHAYELRSEPPHYPWSHNGIFSSLDHASIRRGYQVYKEVCSACHSLKGVSYRQLVNVSHTIKQAKAEAASVEIEDGPDAQGEMFMRPGKLSDKLPKPYKNDQAAKAANNAALPPDLTFIALAREHGLDYIYSLLTGYEEPPEGLKLDENVHYNPFMGGGKISMQAPLYDDIIEYEDGTPSSLSQLAKDVCTFLMWTSQMEHDERKFLALKTILVMPILFLIVGNAKRVKWSSIKTRKISFFTPPSKYTD
ncbi:hypothetical protein GJ496_010667 [Pomphorhynchus laevis]|nr:hypothetical protein GJ496_010667 [Pomphorhynchus laevis]